MGIKHSRSISYLRRPISAVRVGLPILAVGLVAFGCLVLNLAELSASQQKTADAEQPIVSKGGALVIGGGAKLPDSVKQEFLNLAGGPEKAKVIHITSANSFAGGPGDLLDLEEWRRLGATNVSLFHTRDRDQANDPSFVKPLDEANAVWIGGGRQDLLSKAYVDTEVENALKRVLDRGGVVGGTSAGAAILTKVMIESGRRDAVEGKGFDLLPGAVVDQHFLRRNRMARLQGVLKKHPELIGIGIDERTAMVVRGRKISVVGESYVVACAPGTQDRPERIDFLKAGDSSTLVLLTGPERVVVIPGVEFNRLSQ